MVRIVALIAALVLFVIAGLVFIGALGDNTDPNTALGLIAFGLVATTVAKFPLPE